MGVHPYLRRGRRDDFAPQDGADLADRLARQRDELLIRSIYGEGVHVSEPPPFDFIDMVEVNGVWMMPEDAAKARRA